MGDQSDDMNDGLCCSECGVYFIKDHDYPVLCRHCWYQGSQTQKSEHPEMGEEEETDNE